MKTEELYEFLISEAERPFSGWDFSYLGNRIRNAPLSWCYMSEILPLIREVDSLLDMGTGGGEFLSLLLPLPKHTSATEGYMSNLPIAKSRLEPLGVKVCPYENDENLPFDDKEFDLIINRHESYSPQEVFRILKPGGSFITQQVGDKNDAQLRLILTDKEELENHVEWNLAHAKKELKNSGFKVEKARESLTLTRIFDVGAIVYYFKAIPWELPHFTVEKYQNKLKIIHERILNNGYIDLEANNHRFFIKARK